MESTGLRILLGAIKVVVFLYDVFTYPIYLILQEPWKKRELSERRRAEPISKHEGITYHTVLPLRKEALKLMSEKVDTMEKMINHSVRLHRRKNYLGTRQVLDEEEEKQPDGRVFKKFVMGDYDWWTYGEVDQKAEYFGKGMREIGLKTKERAVLFAETRAEWLVAIIGCFKQNFPVVTLYATLGEEALAHGIRETRATHVITSHELLPKFKNVLHQCPHVKHVVYMPDQLKKTHVTGYKEGVEFHTFESIVEKGVRSDKVGCPPEREDTAIIMYTSGSTGVPKGVVLTHYNLITSMLAFSNALDVEPNQKEIYIAFLPLAHVLELLAELMCMFYGYCIGYSSPLTMTDKSSKVKRGSKGDATILKPTVMASVPLILDRIYKTVLDQLEKKGPLMKAIFMFAYKYKLKWTRRGHDTPILNRILYRPIRALVGGNVRLIASGGAPLSPDTHDFIRAVFCCPVMQGYGLTETTACTTIMDPYDMTVGQVGSPQTCCDVRLVDWEEGNYRVTDTPNPRGEVLVGGDCIANGYFELPQKTAEDFFEENGKKWFRTGDIGEFLDNGCLKIIDRKKDLVKLQFGEYVSLGKVESELKTLPEIDNICVYGDSTQLYTVGLVVPSESAFRGLAIKLGKPANMSIEELCNDQDMKRAMLKAMQAHGKQAMLEKFEIPGEIKLCHEVWTPDMGLVTAAFKLKRKSIQDKYQKDIDNMYRKHGS